MTRPTVALALALALLGTPGGLFAAAPCGPADLRFVREEAELRVGAGEEVELEPDATYILTVLAPRPGAREPVTPTRIDYGVTLGFPRHPLGETREVVRVVPQDQRDVTAARARLETRAPGRVAISYRVEEGGPGGGACAPELVWISVRSSAPATAEPDGSKGDEGGATDEGRRDRELEAEEAATAILDGLYEGLLLRARTGPNPAGRRDRILAGGLEGAAEVASELASLPEMRSEMPIRAINANPRLEIEGADPRRTVLTEEILRVAYERLFGRADLEPAEHLGFVSLLHGCIYGFSPGNEAYCRDLGTTLVEHPFFSTHFRAELRAIGRVSSP